MLRVALTGGIASGKSAAAATFRELGIPVIDTDRIARELVEPGMPGYVALLRAFGEKILDESGRLNRAQLREAIFSDIAMRQQVNALLHPLILAAVDRELASTSAPYVIIEIPLLAETGLATDFDRVLVIDASDDVRIGRIQKRDQVSAVQAQAALNAQAPREDRLWLATDVIENNGSLDALRMSVENMHRKYLELAKRFASAHDGHAE